MVICRGGCWVSAVARCTLAISDYPCFRIVTEYRHHEDFIAGLRAAGPAGHYRGAAPGNPQRALQPADQRAGRRRRRGGGGGLRERAIHRHQPV